MKVYLDLSGCKALGDAICATPTIKKLSESYDQKLFLITDFADVFKNNPFVEKCYPPSIVNMEYVKDNFILHNSFYNIGVKNENGVEYKHNVIDIRQFHAINLGFMLDESEMECTYTPDEYEDIDGLPENYVAIHPVKNWESRTWDESKWISLVEVLNSKSISVVAIGKDSNETGFFNIDKQTINLNITNGLNLINKTSVSQAWHIINKSFCFVTMDSGLLHLAGTTDTHIIHLGSSINPYFRIPYRKGGQGIYKYDYVSGSCNLQCASNMKHGVKEWGNIQGVPPLIGCLENKGSFECHPSFEQVFNKVMSL